MAVELRIAPEAAEDLAEAYEWYETRRAGLGEDFITCVEACTQAILRSPQMFPEVHEQYRRALVRRFPHLIFYEYQQEVVTVYAVFHAAQSPDRWRERLG